MQYPIRLRTSPVSSSKRSRGRSGALFAAVCALSLGAAFLNLDTQAADAGLRAGTELAFDLEPAAPAAATATPVSFRTAASRTLGAH